MMRTAFVAVVERIRAEQGGAKVPGFDPSNGNEDARYLFLLEAPGPKAVARDMISFDNPDQTAKNLRLQLERAGIQRSDIALWNVIPWYLGNEQGTKIRGAMSSDVKQGLVYLEAIIDSMPRLEFIVLVGGAARQAHIHLSQRARVRILSCHHPSPKVQNTVQGAFDENVGVFQFMRTQSREG
jgi:uracil-DNA glycosylase